MWFVATWFALALMQTAAPPAPQVGCKGAGYDEFDFWVGEWEVVNPAGTVAGVNSITRDYDGCVVREQWRGARGMNGSSFNIYDPRSRRWHQTWVDNTGTLLTIDGAFTNGSMRLVGKGVSPQGTSLNRVTFTPNKDGTLRQLWEVSADEGKTWTIAFDGTYRKRTGPPK